MAPAVDEVTGQRQVALLAGAAVQLDEGGLDLGVAAHAVDAALARAEDRVDVVGEAPGDVEEPGAAGGAPERDRRLDQVPGAVQLVAPVQLGPAPVGAHHLVVGLEVAAVLLGLGEQPGDLLDAFGQPGRLVGAGGRVPELPGDRFQPLVDVRVEERQVVDVLAGRGARREAEVVEVARLREAFVAVGDADVGVDRTAGGPEAAGDLGVARGPQLGAGRCGRHEGAGDGSGADGHVRAP